MKRVYLLLLVVLVWAFSTINTSGWGVANRTDLITIIVLVTLFLFVNNKAQSKLRLGGPNARLSFFTFLSFVLIPVVFHGSFEGASYLTMILLVYCFSQFEVTSSFITISGYIIAGLGLATLFVFNRMDFLSGWNENQIAMIGLFSCLYYFISLSGHLTLRKITIGIAISLLYITLLQPTNARASILFIFIAIAIIYTNKAAIKLLKKKSALFWCLSIPLLLAIMVVLFPNFSLFEQIKEISASEFSKSTAFNGRDEIWKEAFLRLPKNFFLGTGEFEVNHHNSAVAVLDTFGVIGYVCWFRLLRKQLELIKTFLADEIVFGCMISFLIIFWQQSLELGFVSPLPNMVPYMILGLGLGRVNTIRKWSR